METRRRNRTGRAAAAAVAASVGALLFFASVFGAIRLHATLGELARAPILHDLDSGPEASIVLDRHDRPVFTFYQQRRIKVPLEDVSPLLVEAVLAAEDQRFYEHNGLDPVRIAGAVLENVRAGRIREGASTISQQLVRLTSLSRERTLERKLKEAILAAQAEERYSKRQILEAYLNRVYLGDGYYGVEAASRGYFGKRAQDLELHEAALLAGLIKAPSILAPTRNPEDAIERRDLVLRLMRRAGAIDAHQYEAAVAESYAPPQAGPPEIAEEFGLHFKQELQRRLVERFGSDRLYEGGLRIYATMDPDLQRAAEETILAHVERVEARRRTDARGRLQAALVALDPATGEVLALAGGRDFGESPFNRATQARRQPGSAFKPLIFAAALERGYAPGTLLRDLGTPIDTPEGPWLPADPHAESESTLRRALTVSSNRAAAQLLQRIGISGALDVSSRMGIRSPLPAVPSLALGTGEVTLLELTSAYGVLANEGVRVAPLLIRRVEDRAGRVLWQANPETGRVLRRSTAFLMSSMLADVIDRGTAAAARTRGFRLRAAGKTGTTNDFADAWFIGYTPRLVAGVWFGYDERRTILPRGFASTVAVPAWADFMTTATRGEPDRWYETPPDVESVAICVASGLRATDRCRAAADQVTYELGEDGSLEVVRRGGIVDELFPVGAVPWEDCDVHVPERYEDLLHTTDGPYPTDGLNLERDPGWPESETAAGSAAGSTYPVVGTSGIVERRRRPASQAPPSAASGVAIDEGQRPAPRIQDGAGDAERPARVPFGGPRARRVTVSTAPADLADTRIELNRGLGAVPGGATIFPARPPSRVVIVDPLETIRSGRRAGEAPQEPQPDPPPASPDAQAPGSELPPEPPPDSAPPPR